MKKIVAIFLLLAVAFSLCACGTESNSNKVVKATVVTNSGQTQQMTLKEIKDIVESNSLLFEKEYAGAKITVTSTITKIGGAFELTSWFDCDAYVELDASDSVGTWFHPVTEAYALTLKVGQEITVTGKIGLATVSGFDVYILYDKISPYDDSQNANSNNNGNNQNSTNESAWEIGEYVDQFDNPTGEKYVAPKNYLRGTFSNSATTDSRLEATLVIDTNGGTPEVAIFLYEYGNSLVKNPYSKTKWYDITMLCSDGRKISLCGAMASGGDRIFIVDDSSYQGTATTVINELCNGGESFQLYIAESDRPVTNYLFKVYKSNFQEQYKQISNGVIPGGNTGSTVRGKFLIYSMSHSSYVTDVKTTYTTINNTTRTILELGNKSQAAEFTVIDNGDGTVSFRLNNGSYLSSDASNFSFTTQQSDYTKFVMEEVNGGYCIRCAVANYKGVPQYFDIYMDCLSTYGFYADSDVSLYTFVLESVN